MQYNKTITMATNHSMLDWFYLKPEERIDVSVCGFISISINNKVTRGPIVLWTRGL